MPQCRIQELDKPVSTDKIFFHNAIDDTPAYPHIVFITTPLIFCDCILNLASKNFLTQFLRYFVYKTGNLVYNYIK